MFKPDNQYNSLLLTSLIENLFFNPLLLLLKLLSLLRLVKSSLGSKNASGGGLILMSGCLIRSSIKARQLMESWFGMSITRARLLDLVDGNDTPLI
jgi:hypothetical protein